MSKVYYIFRHGKSIEDGKQYPDQNEDFSLLQEGKESTQRISEYFLEHVPVSINYSSPWKRCVQTSMIVSSLTNKQFIYDDRLHEFHNENFEDLKKRVESFLEDIQGIQEENILICTHGAVIAALKHMLTEDSFKKEDMLDYTLPGELLIIKENKTEILNFIE